jgi:hypothetical protein
MGPKAPYAFNKIKKKHHKWEKLEKKLNRAIGELTDVHSIEHGQSFLSQYFEVSTTQQWLCIYSYSRNPL